EEPAPVERQPVRIAQDARLAGQGRPRAVAALDEQRAAGDEVEVAAGVDREPWRRSPPAARELARQLENVPVRVVGDARAEGRPEGGVRPAGRQEVGLGAEVEPGRAVGVGARHGATVVSSTLSGSRLTDSSAESCSASNSPAAAGQRTSSPCRGAAELLVLVKLARTSSTRSTPSSRATRLIRSATWSCPPKGNPEPSSPPVSTCRYVPRSAPTRSWSSTRVCPGRGWTVTRRLQRRTYCGGMTYSSVVTSRCWSSHRHTAVRNDGAGSGSGPFSCGTTTTETTPWATSPSSIPVGPSGSAGPHSGVGAGGAVPGGSGRRSPIVTARATFTVGVC